VSAQSKRRFVIGIILLLLALPPFAFLPWTNNWKDRMVVFWLAGLICGGIVLIILRTVVYRKSGLFPDALRDNNSGSKPDSKKS
jgi:hypothetical protein